ncbi:MAG: hypothetical protein IKC22_07570 [Bacilli bacterium]|nr:hypothetical protein [Bacilli bacterium]MBR2892208.1 hypothetical protein [Bacilli bacterium]
MSKFYIKKLTAYGDNKIESSIEFSPYLTIICGASNTGKTYIFKCIKYLFGSDKLEIKVNSGYTKFSMVLCVNNKDITFTREINSTDIEVISNYEGVENGIYSTDYEKENNINSVYLSLLGIHEEFKVPYNRNCEMKRFTLRMFLHMLMINEKEIERDLSIVLPKETINKTYFLSHLLYLLYGTDFSVYDPEDSEKTKRIKKAAISKYINDKLYALKERSEAIKNNPFLNSNYDIDKEIQLLTVRLNYIETQLNETFINGQALLKDITERNERLNECTILLNRYVSLESQFTSDIQRLSFISESSSILKENTKTEKCPHCNKDLTTPNEFNVSTDTINAEIFRITSQLDGLMEIKNELLEEIETLNSSLAELQKKKDEVDTLINTVLKPEKRNIEDKINTFKEYISVQSELKTLESFDRQWNDDLEDLYKKQPKKTIYKPFDLFSVDFSNDITREIQTILELCDHPKYNSASFNIKSFDIEINNNSKSTNGKGFTAFYNTTLVLAFRKYLYETARIKPPFYIIDTPLLGLDVGHTHIIKNNLTQGIYNYFVNSVNQSQLIIIENEKDMPTINLKNPKIKYYDFTHDENEGRYGFLIDFTD